MVYAPIALFVYNRLKHTKQLLESLSKAKYAAESDLFIFCDQYKSDKDRSTVEAVRSYIDEYCVNAPFKSVNVIKNSENKGLAKSIIESSTAIIQKYGKIIVIEDDLIVSSDFLSYMNRALEFYEDNKNIWAISGYTFPMKALENYEHDVYMSGRGCSWGWATWKDRWETVDWEVKDYRSFKFNLVKRRAFSAWGSDLPEMLDAYVYGEIHSWAIRWCYEAFKQGKFTVYPKESRVKNCGTDGSGTNFKSSEKKYDTYLIQDASECNFENCDVNEVIRKEFAAKYVKPRAYIKLKLRWFLIKLGILKPRVKK